MQSPIQKLIAEQLNLQIFQVSNTIQLLDEKATVPFISRYRKEKTGSLDEVEIGDIKNLYLKYTELEKRKITIVKSIAEQNKLSPELEKKIEACWDAITLEDIYLPFKPKRKTRASLAKERGLEPLALIIYKQNDSELNQKIDSFLNEEIDKKEKALAGARDIIAEWISEKEDIRNGVRYFYQKKATISSKVIKEKATDNDAQKFRDYFDFSEMLHKCPSHRILAMRRGENEGFLRLYIQPEEKDIIESMERKELKNQSECAQQVKLAIEDAYKRLIQPSIELEFRHLSKEKADKEAIDVFAMNLRQLLLSAPLGQKKILAIDPGIVSGCKVVCLDEQGNFKTFTTLYPFQPKNQKEAAKDEINKLVKKFNIEAIAIGNGTAGRETEQLLKEIKFDNSIPIFMVNENGASIYSASALAREEFPDHDVTVRGAISIGRRLMDPLAELVKIDAKSIGVGQYQHDVNQNELKTSLEEVVESCVNQVGVNLNTASKQLLSYISGIGPSLAENIVNHRTENGFFKSRNELKKVARFGEKAFEQAAGFLRIPAANNPLDNSAVHPERYELVQKMATDIQLPIYQIIKNKNAIQQIQSQKYISKEVGLPTINDILKELEKPGLDPRETLQVFEFANVHTINDLFVGMILPGIVTNITNFGAFVDIGVKQDGMVHISEMANKFIKHPSEIVKLQQTVSVKITEIDLQRKRIQLSMK
jgi:uncharacterized protein